jgi:alkaline phosphatase D
MKRRDFLRGAGAFIVGAKLLPACGDDSRTEPTPDASELGKFAFPQGVASGDPRTTSVVLWTRAIRVADRLADVELRLEVAMDAAFGAVVATLTLTATAASDHTVRVLVTDLGPNTVYHYRFTAGVDQIQGRTRTAPDATADVPVNIAWVSCQDYQSGHYDAYRQMIADDDARAEADRIHFVVHLGDVIYETINTSSSRAIDDDFEYVTLRDRDGRDRIPRPFPSGGGPLPNGARFARTLDDYRHLYKTFLGDPDMQAARARWPFVHTWDDHEFTNDYWQSMANFIDGNTGDEPSQRRKVAANRAWFEYIPAQLTGAVGPAGVDQDAKDFAPADVADVRFPPPNADNFVEEPNNVAAVGSMTIYRSLRWGKHVELVLTDERSYRSDHAIPEDTAALVNAAAGQTVFFDPRNFLPLPLINIFDQGASAFGGNPPATVGGVPNPRRQSPVGTMLGKAQKAWWKATMQASDATWKLWGNEVPLMRMQVKDVGGALGFDRVLNGDAWDGYPTERAELMTFLRTQDIRNVVVLTGDFHAHFAGVIMDDYDAQNPTPVATELVAAGISSNSVFSFYESATRDLGSVRALLTADASAQGGPKFVENINLVIHHGLVSGVTYAQTLSLAAALSQSDPPNPHIRYADTNAQGYGYIKVTEAEVTAELVTVPRPIGAATTTPRGVKRRATLTIPKDDPGGMSEAEVTGTKPFPLT